MIINYIKEVITMITHVASYCMLIVLVLYYNMLIMIAKYSRTSIIRTLGYPNAISNFKIPKDDLIFCKTKK